MVDDGSTDRTGKILDTLSNEIDSLKIIHHYKNEGVGAAMVDGFTAASGDLFFFNSADHQAPMAYLEAMFTMMKSYDLVVARYDKRRDSFLRLLFSKGYHLLIGLLFGIRLHNVNAMKLLKKEVFDKTYNWGRNLCLDVEIVAVARKSGFRIGEISLKHHPRIVGQTKVVSIGNTMRTFKDLIFLYFKLKRIS